MTNQFDAIIIGTGQAGPFFARRLAAASMKVAIVERKLFGGTCVNTGCIPTKTMVASAYAAHIARRAADFGVAIGGSVSVDMRRVKARKDTVSGQSRMGLETWLKNMENCTVYEGHARFESPREVSVGPDRITADRIFINVGGHAAVPRLPGLDQVEYLTNSSMMGIDSQTRGILGAAVLGTGGDEVVHSILDVMYAKAPYTVIQRAVHIHPTVSELIPTMLGDLRLLAG
jgi:pyruvate/2-oxoglutarate dehydrogenase complex dihydrolipoamide dehydrogenase (E3) component